MSAYADLLAELVAERYKPQRLDPAAQPRPVELPALMWPATPDDLAAIDARERRVSAALAQDAA